MKFGHRPLRLFALAFLFAPGVAFSQALYTATQPMSLSAWAGGTGTYVGLPGTISGIPVTGSGGFSNLFNGGRNLGISAGVDLRIWQFHGYLPSVEIRGTYPFAKGNVAAEENALAGIKIEHPFGRYHPYGDFFFGRGEINYAGRGYVSPDGRFLYQQTFSNVLSPGLGVDIDVTHHFAAKFDAQLWHVSVPVTSSGTLDSLALTAAVIYRFDFNHPFFTHHAAARPVNTAP